MKLKWFGHAAFLVTADNGTRVIIDPYTPGAQLSHGEIREAADVVAITHEHGDHNNPGPVKGNPRIVRGVASLEVKGIKIKGIPAFHDESGGKQRGADTLFCFDVDGIRLCHMGDLGHKLNDKQLAELGKVDILLIPVGGYYTIDGKGASEVTDQIKPKVVIPMHFKTPKSSYPISDAEEFLSRRKDVNRPDSSEVEFKAGQLPAATSVIVLKPAL